MSKTLSEQIALARSGRLPFPLPQVGGMHAQPIYAIRTSQLDELLAQLAAAEAERDRLRAFVAAFDAWCEGGLWPDVDVSKMLRDELNAAREAVGK